MNRPIVILNDETDALYRTTPDVMAERFGAFVKARLAAGKSVTVPAQIAFRYAFLARPDLREPAPSPRAVHDEYFDLSVNLARAFGGIRVQ